MYTVGETKDSVSGILAGTNLDKVTGLYKAFQRAARKLIQKADIPEASQKQTLTLYDGVYDYPSPTDIFGGALVDLRPQGITRVYLDDVQKMPVKRFDLTKHILPSGYKVTFENRKGVPILRVATPKPFPMVMLDAMNETTDWVASGSASDLNKDETVFYESPSSLRFVLTGDSTGILTKTLSNTLNLSSYEDVGVAFLALRLPDGATAASLTSIALRLGSDSGNYDEVSVTEGFLGAWVSGEYLLVAFDLSASASTGTPDWSELDYVQVRFAHTETFTNIRVGALWLALPSPHEVLYQTPAIFLNDGALSKTITDDDDQIILNDAAYLLYEHECALAVAIQSLQKDKAKELRAVLYGGEGDEGLYAQYRGDNPSQEIREVGSYYDV